jgi:hypothetical protein
MEKILCWKARVRQPSGAFIDDLVILPGGVAEGKWRQDQVRIDHVSSLIAPEILRERRMAMKAWIRLPDRR